MAAIRMPCSTPKKTTPAVATSERKQCRLADVREAAQDGDIRQRDGRHDHDGGQRRLGQVLEQTGDGRGA